MGALNNCGTLERFKLYRALNWDGMGAMLLLHEKGDEGYEHGIIEALKQDPCNFNKAMNKLQKKGLIRRSKSNVGAKYHYLWIIDKEFRLYLEGQCRCIELMKKRNIGE